MRKHTRAWMKEMGYSPGDYMPCEVCTAPAVDVHHVHGRIGKNYDDPKGLIGLCRACHSAAHSHAISKEFLLNIIANRRKTNGQ